MMRWSGLDLPVYILRRRIQIRTRCELRIFMSLWRWKETAETNVCDWRWKEKNCIGQLLI